MDLVAYLRSPVAIRERCEQLFTLACTNQLNYFRCDLNQLESVATYVREVMQFHYPDLQIPFHSRWRHFEAGNIPRVTQWQNSLANISPLEQARAQFDLVIVSVLLDAGAGDRWRYLEPGTNQTFARSEGLAVASWHLFQKGCFSSHSEQPWQVNAEGLQALTVEQLAEGFQVTDENPLVGLTGRWQLLQRLGQVLQQHPPLFGTDNPRLGYLVDYLLAQAQGQTLAAPTVLQAVLQGLGDIWPGRLAIAGTNLGDVWQHPAIQSEVPGDHYVPFHKLSQWLTYSLLEPLQGLGLTITELDALTGLPEYRNGGLCLDLGLLQVKQPEILQQVHAPESPVIVEWRSLTVSLLDRIAAAVRQQLGMSAAELPLVKVLQGGTWTAGRKIAATLRPGGGSPLAIASDGTVF